jgi:hypothetical protein
MIIYNFFLLIKKHLNIKNIKILKNKFFDKFQKKLFSFSISKRFTSIELFNPFS